MAYYTSPSIVGYNDNPPSNDGVETPSNLVDWDKHIDEIGDPLKAYIDSVNTAAGGGIVLAPYKTAGYAWNTAVTMNRAAGVTLRGEGDSFNASKIIWDGAAGANMLTMNGSRYCTVENMDFDCNSKANVGIYHYWDGSGNSSYECKFKNIAIENALSIGFLLGNVNNYQASETLLERVTVSNSVIGFELLGQNSLNNVLTGCAFKSCGTGMYIASGSLTAIQTLWTQNTTRDIYMGQPETPCVFLGGYTEGSEQFLYCAYAGTNEDIIFIGLNLAADATASPNLFVQDGSSLNVTFEQTIFWRGAGAYINSPIPGAGQIDGYKRFKACRWGNAGATAMTTHQVTCSNPLTGVVVEIDTHTAGALTLIDGDGTPNVVGTDIVETANTVPTIISGLDCGSYGQTVNVLINDSNTTIDFTGTTLKGNGGSDWSPANGDHMTCTFDGTNWRCIVSDNT